jgi:hypothetical protein
LEGEAVDRRQGSHSDQVLTVASGENPAPDAAIRPARPNGADAIAAPILVELYTTKQRRGAIVQFPGGSIAEVHAAIHS